MKYIIQEILPGQIRVEFEDNSWAIVPIPPNSSLEEIDNAVSQYDPDFLPSAAELINSNIVVGLERTSVQKIEEQTETVETPSLPDSVPNQSIIEDFSKISLQEYLIAEYFAGLGDNRLKQILVEKIKKLTELSDFSVEDMIFNLTTTDDDILRQAEEELNNEQ
jgi:hypothetical protein